MLMAPAGVVIPEVWNGDSHHHLAGIIIPPVAARVSRLVAGDRGEGSD